MGGNAAAKPSCVPVMCSRYSLSNCQGAVRNQRQVWFLYLSSARCYSRHTASATIQRLHAGFLVSLQPVSSAILANLLYTECLAASSFFSFLFFGVSIILLNAGATRAARFSIFTAGPIKPAAHMHACLRCARCNLYCVVPGVCQPTQEAVCRWTQCQSCQSCDWESFQGAVNRMHRKVDPLKVAGCCCWSTLVC